MVGKMKMSGLRERLHHVTSEESHDLEHSHSRLDSASIKALIPLRRHVPFIASPLDPKTTKWLEQKTSASNMTLKRRPTVAQQEAHNVSGGIFRKQSEASPLELFFDLFFVANLAVFGFNFSQATPSALGNYIGFFSLMWSFWFNIALHDVRFYVDTVLNRFLKLCQFAIWTAFTGLGPIYTAISENSETRAFQGIALVFMVSRLIFMLQYGVVFWFVRPFKKTWIPCALMTLLYLCSAMAFLGTYLVGRDHALTGQEGVHRVNIWYAVIGLEAVISIIISSVWRIFSFKKTHLVERVGLLTLIIMGEGIIGVIRSIANILNGTQIDIWSATGLVIAGVFLIYLIFDLYFTPIAHDRFGTIRQQVWVLLHYPLHVAILLTEEGSAESMLWATVMGARRRIIHKYPSLSDPSDGFSTVGAMVAKINETMNTANQYYDHLSLAAVYNWLPDLERIQNLTSEYEYASHEFNEHASEIMSEMLNETSAFLFENFQYEGPEDIGSITDPNEKLALYYTSYTVIFTAFYICSGVLLLTLAAMYWIGKRNKTWEEWTAMVIRAIVGAGLPFIAIAAYTQSWQTGFMTVEAGWIVSVVVFSYLFIAIIDNFSQSIMDYRAARAARAHPNLDTEAAAPNTHSHPHTHRPSAPFGPTATISRSHHSSSTNMTEKNHKSKAIHFQERSRSHSNTLAPPTHQIQAHPQTWDESSSLMSSDPTLNVRHSSDESQGQRHVYGRLNTDVNTNTDIDTEYRGHNINEHNSINHNQMMPPRDDRSFEISPVTLTDRYLDRPVEGHHRPEDGREY